MKTNITTDNYEAYLLDYMEGNLSPDETEQLKAFVAARGLDWSELTEDLPRLEAPQIEFEDKERLKKQRAVVPLYVKIASAAAAAGLLLTVGLWPEKQLPKTEPIADLKPIAATRIEMPFDLKTLPIRTNHFVNSQVVVKEKPVVAERVEIPLLAQLEPQKPQSLPVQNAFNEPDFYLLAYKMNTDLAFVQMDGNSFPDDIEDERNPSLIGKGLLWLTQGRHDSFASLIGAGLHKAKQDLTEAATDMALAAYYRADERFEEAKEYWGEKLEK